MKSILFVTNEFPVLSETFVLNLIQQAKNKGHRVNVICKKKLAESCEFNIFELQSPPISRREKVLDAITFLFNHPRMLSAFYGSIFKWGGLKSLGNIYPLINYSKLKKSYDIYHVQFGINGVSLAIAKKANLITGKIITTFHGYDAFSSRELPFISKEYYKTLFEVGDVFTANSPYLMHKLLELGCPKQKLILLPMTINIPNNISPMKLKGDNIKLISVGRLIPLKGHIYGLKLVSYLKKKGYNVEYIIIGEGPEKDNLRKAIDDEGLREEVILKGALSNAKVFEYLYHSDFFLMTSITDSEGRCETQGVVTIEAQSVGLPAFIFDSGGVKYTIEDGKTGRIFKEKDYLSMANAIITLINDPEKYFSMSSAAIDFVKSYYSNDNQQKVLDQIYKD